MTLAAERVGMFRPQAGLKKLNSFVSIPVPALAMVRCFLLLFLCFPLASTTNEGGSKAGSKQALMCVTNSS